MKKKFLSVFLALALCMGLLPTAVFAEETGDQTLACTCEIACTEDSRNADCLICGAEGAELTECCGDAEVQQPDEAVTAVQARIDALPTLDSVTAEDYDDVQDAYDAYDALDEEQQAQIVGAEVFEDLFEWFNAQTAPVDGSYVAISNEKGFADYLKGDVLGSGTYKLMENVTITSTIKVCSDVVLDLNGYVLKFESAVYDGDALGCVIEVNATGNLKLTDSGSDAKHYFYAKTDSDLWRWDADAEGSSSQPDDTSERQYKTVTGGVITGGRNGNGGGIVVWGSEDSVKKDTVFTMEGGSIIGCTSNYGGGVFVSNKNANFTMKDGEIAGCAASSEGGGVYVDEGTVFDMEGGKIHDCVSPRTQENNTHGRGGGVCNHGTFAMTNATIENCKVYTKATVGGDTKEEGGGGVYSSGTFKMKNSKIIGCDAGNGTGDGIFLSGDSAKLKDIVNEPGYILKSNDNTTIDLEGKSCGNVSCTLCSHGSFDADGKCTECGLPFVAEVEIPRMGGTIKTYIAAGTEDGEGHKGVLDALKNGTNTVKLLADIEGSTSPENDIYSYRFRGEHTLDLNGHKWTTLDGIIIYDDDNYSKLTIKDSSEGKNGEINLGTVSVSSSGILNIESGKLKTTYVASDENHYDGIDVWGTMTVSGTVEVTNGTYIYVCTDADIKAMMNVKDGKIIGDIAVYKDAVLNVSGGEIDSEVSLWVLKGGIAKISGGKVDSLKAYSKGTELSGGTFGKIEVVPDEDTNYDSDVDSVLDILANGSAYFDSVKNTETGAVTLGTMKKVDANAKTLGNGTTPVMVSAHTCTFEKVGGEYTCTKDGGCGRSYGQEPIAYIDYVDGKAVEKLCTEYDVVKIPQATNGRSNDFDLNPAYSSNNKMTWFVATEDVTVEKLDVGNGPVHLILCDGVTLTATEGAGDDSSLIIYGQKQNTGKLVASGGKDEDDTFFYGIYIKDLTINGGDISATGRDISTTGDVSDYETYNTYGIYCTDKLTVNGGKVVAKGGNVSGSGDSDSYGIRVGDDSDTYAYAYINGGTIEATGGNITGDKGEEQFPGNSYGIKVSGGDGEYMRVKGGTLTATGGSVDVSAKMNTAEYGSWCESRGLHVAGYLDVYDGTINAKSGNVTLKRTDGFGNTSDNAESVGLRAADLYLEDGEINLASGTATLTYDPALAAGSNKGYTEAYEIMISNYAGISGGKMKPKSGYFESVQAYGDAELADLLQEGYAYWKESESKFLALENYSYFSGVSIKPCTHSASSGVCDYCGKDLGSAPSGGGSSGGGGGSSAPSNPTVGTETITMPDGTTIKTETKKDGTVVETITKPDGSTTKTETKTETGKDGTTVETKTTTTSDGSSSTTTTTTDENGTKTVSNVTVSGEAAKGGNTVILPVDEVKPESGNNSNEIQVNVPSGGATVEIPVENPTPGTIVVIVNEDGTETIVSGAKVTENGIQITLKENATIKIVDGTKEFGDVKKEDYFANAVAWAAANGITGGIDANNFGPHLSCTRAQLVTFLWRAAGCPSASGGLDFEDMAEGAYYQEAVRWATSLGIVSGYGNGRFGTDDAITREQMAVMLYHFAQNMGMDTTQGGMAVREFADYESISGYAAEAMQWAVNAGILHGSEGNLMPSQPCTRAQIVAMLYRLLG